MKKKKRRSAGTRRGGKAGHRTGSPPSLKTDVANSHSSAPSAFTHGHSPITAGKYGQAAWSIPALGLLVLVSYIPALSGGFVWDDSIWTSSGIVQRWSGLYDLWLPDTYAGNKLSERHYWPLLYMSLWLDHKLWGMEPMGYHATNILFHLINSVLLWKLLQRLAIPGAWLIAAVFAVHPLNVEPVAWVIGRKDLLATLFYFTTLLIWLRFTEKPQAKWYALSLCAFIAALLSKSIAITLPVTLLIIQWWKHGQIGKQDLLRTLPFFVTAVCVGLADLAFYTARGEVGVIDYSIIDRVLIAAHALWFYVGKLMWPTELSVVYPRWQISVADPWGWVFVIAAVGLVTALWLLRHRIGRGPLAGVLFFGVTLAPVLGFVSYSYMEYYSFVADRYQYLAGVGVLAVVIGGATYGLVTACQAGRLPREIIKLGQAVVVVILGVLGTLAWQHAGIYRDNIIFYRHIISLNPDAQVAHKNLGAALIEQGYLEEGLAATKIAMNLLPNDPTVYTNLGVYYSETGNLTEAEKNLRHALELDPKKAEKIYKNLGGVLFKQGQLEEALATTQIALTFYPNDSGVHANLGAIYNNMARLDEAEKHLSRALELDPRNPGAHHNLSLILFKRGQLQESLAIVQKILTDRPNDPELYITLGKIHNRMEKPDEAEKYFRRAIELDPHDSLNAYTGLADLWVKQQRYDEVLTLLQSHVELVPDNSAAWSNRGFAFFHMGKLEEAKKSFDRALELDPGNETARANHGQVLKAIQDARSSTNK